MHLRSHPVAASLLVSAFCAVRICDSFSVSVPVQQYHRRAHQLASSLLTDDTETSDVATTTTTSSFRPRKDSTASVWFPTRIQDSLAYDTVVQRLYLRHIVTETQAMATLALQQATQYKVSATTEIPTTRTEDPSLLLLFRADPFAQTAALVSTCTATRPDGGKIGWVERPTNTTMSMSTTTVPSSILSSTVTENLFHLGPKAGDVHLIHDESNQRWHVIQVTEVWVDHMLALRPLNQSSAAAAASTFDQTKAVGHYQGTNALIVRRKLKGMGVLPEFPSLSTYHIQTTGCQMNVADSERLAGILENDLQLTPVSDPLTANLVVFNTCSIRDHAEQKLYDALGPYAAAKRKGKQIALVVTGCVAQQEGEALLRRVPEIDVVLGPQYIPHLQNVLAQVAQGHQLVATSPMLLQEHNDNVGLHNKPVRGHNVRAWVNIIHGCNEHCTYCVVPGTRGMEQSRTMESILQECVTLASAGYKEVTLLGQNIDAYGRDMVPKRTFAGLLEYLNHNLPDPMRIRYVTSHPRYFSDRVIDAVADLDKVCECFHVPFQAGDDEVLKQMRRGYTYDSYLKIIHKIRAKAPDAAICADIIVGFPGESEEAFQKTLQLMEEVKFDNVNSFAYSPRPNTEAALWSNQVDEQVKSERLQRVQQLAMKHGMERSERYLGRIEEVLVEDANPRDSNQIMGRTRQGRQVYFDGDLSVLRGEFVNVKITEARTWSLMGEIATR